MFFNDVLIWSSFLSSYNILFASGGSGAANVDKAARLRRERSLTRSDAGWQQGDLQV